MTALSELEPVERPHPEPRQWSHHWASVRHIGYEHRWFALVVGVEFIAAALVNALGWADTLRAGVGWRTVDLVRWSLLVALAALPILVAWDYWHMCRLHSGAGAHRRWYRVWAIRCSPQVVGGVLVAVVLTAASAILLDGFKNLLTLGQLPSTSHWDARFAEWGRLLHGGHYPHEYLAAIWTRPRLLKLVTAPYLLWYPLMAWMNVWQAWSSDRPRRAQYFLAYALIWLLLGVMGALVLPSVGPAFYGRLLGASPYTPLERALDAAGGGAPAWARGLQAVMWDAYVRRDPIQWLGISAMPSLHVGMATLYTLTVWDRFPRLRWSFLAFTILIMLGSVLLGWHYAIDGYAAVLAVWVIWHASGRVVHRSVVPLQFTRQPREFTGERSRSATMGARR